MATALDANQKTNITLSGSNLVATSTGAGGVRTDRSLSKKSYFEGVLTTLAGTPQIGVSSTNWDHATALGTGNNTIGYQPSGVVRSNNATLATIATYVQGDRIGVAVDPLNRLIWFRVNNGNWNNSALNDPAAGVGGIDYSTVTLGTLVAAVSASITGTVWTMKFSTAFTDTPPTGFASIDDVGYTLAVASSLPTAPMGVAFPTYGLTVTPLPRDSGGKQFFPGGAITVVSGTTKEGGSPAGSKRVDVYDRVTGELLGTTISDGSGAWSIPCLGRPAVRVVGSDPTTYNSVVYDNVVPV